MMSEYEEDIQSYEIDLVIPHFRDHIRQVEERQPMNYIHVEKQLLPGMGIMLKFVVSVNYMYPESESFLSVVIVPKKISSNRQSHADIFHTLWGALSVTDNNGYSRFSQSFECDYSRSPETTFSPIIFWHFVHCCTLLNDPDEYFPEDQLKIHCSISCTENLQSANRTVDAFIQVFFDFLSEDHTTSIFTIETAEGTEYRLNFDTPLFAYLKTESPVFRAMAELDFKERHNKYTVIVPEEFPALFTLEHFLMKRSINTMSLACIENLCQLYIITDKYELLRAHEMFRNILESRINCDNVKYLLILADRHSDEHLKSEATRYLHEHWVEYMLSDTSNAYRELTESDMQDLVFAFGYKAKERIDLKNSDSSYRRLPTEQIMRYFLDKSLVEGSSYIN